MTEDLVPPYDLAAEQGVLGAMMMRPEAIWEAQAILEPGDFYQPKHETIYRAIRTLTDSQRPADMIAVSDELQRTGQLQRAGDAAYLAEIVDGTITAMQVSYYATIVRDHALRRRMIGEAQRILQAAYTKQGDAQEELERARTGLDRVVRAATTSVENVAGSFQRVVTALDERPLSTPSPWPAIDDLIVGLVPGKLYIIGARPGEGKSLAALQFARAMCVRGNVAFSSLEMGEDELTERLIASMAEVSLSSLTRHTLSPAEWERVAAVRSRIQPMPLFIDDRGDVTVTQIKSYARSVARRGRMGGVVVDYVQLVSGGDSEKKRYEVLGETTRQLKVMAKELECPVLVLSQLNRESARGGKLRLAPSLADLRESGSIEQDADVVILLQRVLEADGQPGGELDVIVAKNRSGLTASRRLRFEGHFARIVSDVRVPVYDAPVPE